jgi:hypothetical protein
MDTTRAKRLTRLSAYNEIDIIREVSEQQTPDLVEEC